MEPTALAEELAVLLREATPIDALALTGGEPLVQSEFLAVLLQTGRFGVPVLLETNGVLPQRLREVLPLIHIISMDIKLPSNSGEGAFWDEHARFLELARTKDLYVKILVDQDTSEQDLIRAATLVADVAGGVPAFIQPVVDRAGTQLIGAERLTHLCLLARQHMRSVRLLPQVHKMLGML